MNQATILYYICKEGARVDGVHFVAVDVRQNVNNLKEAIIAAQPILLTGTTVNHIQVYPPYDGSPNQNEAIPTNKTVIEILSPYFTVPNQSSPPIFRVAVDTGSWRDQQSQQLQEILLQQLVQKSRELDQVKQQLQQSRMELLRLAQQQAQQQEQHAQQQQVLLQYALQQQAQQPLLQPIQPAVNPYAGIHLDTTANPSPKKKRMKIEDIEKDMQHQIVDLSKIFVHVNSGTPTFEEGGVIDLIEALGGMHMGEDDKFLPMHIYVRPAMNTFLQETVGQDWFCHVIGSPGIGKSVVGFLSALLFVATSSKYDSILYIRRTENSREEASIFMMEKIPTSNNTVHVKYTRSEPQFQPVVEIYKKYYPLQTNKTRPILDGVTYVKGTTPSKAGLITSGGHPGLPNEARHTTKIYTVESWTVEDIFKCLKKLPNIKASKSEVRCIYSYLGGNIRDTVAAFLQNTSLESIKDELRKDVEECDKETLELIVTSTKRDTREKSFDRLRSMYKSGKTVYQIPRSEYIIKLIQSERTVTDVWDDLEKAKKFHLGTIYGIFFELYCHCVMDMFSINGRGKYPNLQPSNRSSCIKFTTDTAMGGWKHSTMAFTAEDVYWQPEAPNYPDIDAAIVVNNTIHCLQYFASKGGYHDFNINTFDRYFLQNNPKKWKKHNVVVYFVTPKYPFEESVDLFPFNGFCLKGLSEDLKTKYITVNDTKGEMKWPPKKGSSSESIPPRSFAAAAVASVDDNKEDEGCDGEELEEDEEEIEDFSTSNDIEGQVVALPTQPATRTTARRTITFKYMQFPISPVPTEVPFFFMRHDQPKPPHENIGHSQKQFT
eukprot:CAMPEP_0119561050 /NCGR_PEP_ID=MMETSP1352-20130426/16528_1 /TAXON_ID=265584 /ORGANISM="Stauroneis constricta, Strain CCMP1120" /LENGTH=828 /DNA_ID=CAMNT_0007609157 /DNA_START=108 /DNA_END=2594 /DNA_ORIENTATION=-